MDDLENSMFHERNQTWKLRVVWSHLHEIARGDKFVGTESRSVTARGQRKEGMGSDRQWDRASSWRNKNVLELDSGDGAQFWAVTKNHSIVHFKWVSFVAWVLFFNFFKKGKKQQPCWAKGGKHKNSTYINFRRPTFTTRLRTARLGYNKDFKWWL